MDTTQFVKSFDRLVRLYVYDHFTRTGQAPTIAEIAQTFSSPLPDIQAAFQRLVERKALVLQKESGEILMAEPFSAVPTPFRVETEEQSWWGNCIWDALGIPAMLNTDATIITSCGDCGEKMVLTIKYGFLRQGEGVVHYLVPARDWWRDVIFT